MIIRAFPNFAHSLVSLWQVAQLLQHLPIFPYCGLHQLSLIYSVVFRLSPLLLLWIGFYHGTIIIMSGAGILSSISLIFKKEFQCGSPDCSVPLQKRLGTRSYPNSFPLILSITYPSTLSISPTLSLSLTDERTLGLKKRSSSHSSIMMTHLHTSFHTPLRDLFLLPLISSW